MLSLRCDQRICVCRRPDDMGSDGAIHQRNIEVIEDFEDIE